MWTLEADLMRTVAARAIRWRWAAALGLALAGCGGERGPDLGSSYPVKGKVTLPDGKPLADTKVNFKGPAYGGATTGSDGSFKIEGEGLPAGEYRVYLEGGARGGKRSMALPYPTKYLDEDASDLTAIVKPEGPNDFSLQLSKDDASSRRARGGH